MNQIEGGMLVEAMDMMNTDRMYDILRETTQQFRKGETVETSGIVTDIYLMPHVSEAKEDLNMVDCHFVVIGVDKTKANKHCRELIEILETYPEPERLAGGPSYIEVGAQIGSQSAAFQLFALGQILGFWTVITPAAMGIDGSVADDLAGRGMVMISGFKKQQVHQ